jgi:hypothetical protein
MARGPGVPARASCAFMSSCAFMYCISSALTVCQSSANSFATSEIDACRQRRPTKWAKALGVERVVCQKVEPFLFHLAAATAIDTPHLQLKQYPHVPAGQVAHLPDFAVVPSHFGRGRQRAHPQPRAERFRQRIEEIVGEVVGVDAAAAIAGKEQLSPDCQIQRICCSLIATWGFPRMS